MKRYSVSYARLVNERASKSGIRFHYSDRTDNVEEVIERYKDNRHAFGIKITDSQTKKVVYEDMRPFKGTLTITVRSEFSDSGFYTYTQPYVDLQLMREDEHKYRYGIFSKNVIKVEREILAP